MLANVWMSDVNSCAQDKPLSLSLCIEWQLGNSKYRKNLDPGFGIGKMRPNTGKKPVLHENTEVKIPVFGISIDNTGKYRFSNTGLYSLVATTHPQVARPDFVRHRQITFVAFVMPHRAIKKN